MAVPNKFVKILIIVLCVLVFICLLWTAFSLIGRVKTDAVIPPQANFRMVVTNPVRLIDGVLEHESINEISSVPALASVLPVLNTLRDNKAFKSPLVRLVARGNAEFALLPDEQKSGTFLAVWDMGLASPLLRVFSVFSGFANIKNLYYMQAGRNSRFEYRTEKSTLFIGPYRNLLFITNNSNIFEARGVNKEAQNKMFSIIKPSAYDAAFLVSPDFISSLLSNQDQSIASVINNIEINSTVEAGLSVYPKKLELRLTAPLSSSRAPLSRLLEQKSQAPGMSERIPSSAQYATVLSAGTLEELFQAAIVFKGPSLEDAYRTADSSARVILGMTLNDLLFSWSGKEFSAFGLEGRPHPVYAIQITNERKRQEVFDKAFKSVALSENARLNLDGVRIPRIELPEFLQSLLRRWNLFLPSPYYTIYKDYLLVSESAETLLSALRSMQRNDVLPKTTAWRNIAGGRNATSAFSLYYSLDLSMPFFLRKSTPLSGFIALYRQGLTRMSFDKAPEGGSLADISLVLVPGSGSGVTLVNSLAIETKSRPSNRISGAGKGNDVRVFISAGDTVVSVNSADKSVKDFSGQGPLWSVPVDGTSTNLWVVNDKGRVILMNGDLEPANGFPVLTGLRVSSAPVSFGGKLYLCDDDGKVHTIDANGAQTVWETSFTTPLRSPPSFMTGSGKNARTYAAVYPKSFFGEIWLLDADGKAMPNWPASIISEAAPSNDDEDYGFSQTPAAGSGIGFGSPLVFSQGNKTRVAFVSQNGELFIFDENAAPVSPFPLFLKGVFYIQPVYDGDFLWLVSADGTLFRVSFEGEVLYQSIPGFSVKEEGCITTFDYDGDKSPEVFITGEGNAMYAFTRNFRSLEGFPLPMWGTPYFVPAQGNKKAGIYGIGMDRRLYFWQFK